jgi:glycosyltransferase involved in cell wall biosynthesis
MAPHKGLGTLLAAARQLAREDPRLAWELSLYGAPSTGRHRHYAAHVLAPPSERIHRPPPFSPDEAPRVLAGLSALALPSEWDENAPLALLQALATGVPVLASDVPGIAELARGRASVRLVPPGDVAAWGRALAAVARGELGRDPEPGLVLGLAEHLDRLERSYERLPKPARG